MAVEDVLGGFNAAEFAQSALDVTLVIVSITLGFAILGAIIWYFYKEMQFKYLATVHYVDTSENNKGFIKFEQTVKARKLTKTNKLHLKRFNIKIDIPPSDAWKRAGKTWKVYLQHDGVRMFAPSIPAYNSPLTFSPMSYQIMNAFIDEGKSAIARHLKGNFWSENKSAIIFFTAMAFSIAVIIISLEQAQKIAEQMFAAASANRESLLEAGKQAFTSTAVLP